MRKYLLLVLMSIPFFSSCISDDCTDCADMTYDTKVRLKITWPSNLSSTKSAESPELDIHDFTLFVFNVDGSLNTIKKVNNPTFSTTIPYSSSLTMNITSNAKYIYAIANCDDLLSNLPTSYIATQVNQNMTTLENFFDSTLAVDYDKIIENGCLVHTGRGDIVSAGESNPYNYESIVNLKPIVSKFDIKVSSVTGTTPPDYIGCIQSIDAFVLNSRSKAKLFSIPTIANINSNYIHGAYESFWNGYGQNTMSFQNSNSTSITLKGNLSLNSTTLSLYSPENDISTSLGNGYITLVVLKIRYKMVSIDGTQEVFDRFFTVSLTTPTISTSSNIRGKRYTIDFKLSGKVWGALSPLSSMMAPYSPVPYKETKDLIYVPQEKYSTVKMSEWN